MLGEQQLWLAEFVVVGFFLIPYALIVSRGAKLVAVSLFANDGFLHQIL